ncbi:MAG TPA: UDP-N-acetylglucosamine 2-epimerase [Nitrospirota bacterium]|nr:UDP-N-acetylglucosamine 2-epimerase [Nitrospirota bacterium]
MSRRRICVVTGSRAEYGLLYWLLKEIQEDAHLELQIITTGMHLSPEFGSTYRVIEEDGFMINAKVEMLLSSDTPVGIAKSIGLGVIGCADALDRLRPDILVLLGDRFEILAAAQAAMLAKIPIAHLHGGETTQGLLDEAIRHAITKMSHLHFVATEPYRQRVVQLGESPERVFNYGALGLDNILKLTLLSRDKLQEELNFSFRKVNFLVTYHPVTLSAEGPERAMNELFRALDRFPEASVVFTKPNADTLGRIICNMIDDYVDKHIARSVSYTSLGQLKYLSAVSNSEVIIGNSSSGIIEVPALGKPSVNIGDRQKGRLKGPSVIDCDDNAHNIVIAIEKALSAEFKEKIFPAESPYGVGGASKKIKQKLEEVNLNGILFKKFFELITPQQADGV